MSEKQKTATREEFLLEIDEILGLRPGTLRGNESLEDLPNWDSVTLIALISMAELTSDIHISPNEILECSTVADLMKLAGVDKGSF
jgi:acyl carrier protein